MSQERESWGNHCEFFLSSLGLAVGLGNVWRFPYVCYTNGGGSFLIPYLAMLIFVGLPAFFLELSLGQYSRVGANKVFGRMVPAFNGLGYAMILVRFFVNIYYVVIMAWAIYYLAVGFRKELPWGSCTDEWSTYDCYTKQYNDKCISDYNSTDVVFYKSDCVEKAVYCKEHEYDSYDTDADECFDLLGQGTRFDWVVGNNSISPAEDYFNGKVLGLYLNEAGERYSWDNYGSLQWELVLCLLGSWVLICLTLIKGIQSYGKVAYVITLSPYFVLTVLLGYAATKDGASNGIKYLFDPEWEKLTEVNIWASAASQILFSLSVAFGSQLVLSSYNDFRNNSHRDSIIVGLCNSLTSLYAGIVVFMILGFIADQAGTDDVGQVVKGGISLAFVSYPSAVLAMDIPPLWSFLFFFMLINLAMSSICGGVQTFLAFVLDEKPSLTKYRAYIVIALCSLFFLAGLPMCTNGGILLFTVFDKRCTSSLLFVCLLEVIHVVWVYGVDKFFDNLSEMGMDFNTPLRWFWTILWKLITPAILAFITVLAWINHEPMEYDKDKFPPNIEALGWIMELLPLAIVLLYPIIPYIKFYREGFRGSDLWAEMFRPAEKWYQAQMDRRTAEAEAAKDAKFAHHNLAFEISKEDTNDGIQMMPYKGQKEAKVDENKPPTPPPPFVEPAETIQVQVIEASDDEVDAVKDENKVSIPAVAVIPPEPEPEEKPEEVFTVHQNQDEDQEMVFKWW